MIKRNEGYTLAYVVVVLGVLASVAMATMTMALIPQKSQHVALERMRDKYAAQGLIEQVVALLEHCTEKNVNEEVLAATEEKTSAPDSVTITLENSSGYITVTAKTDKTTVTAVLQLTPNYENPNIPVADDGTDGETVGNTDGNGPQEQTISSYTVTYHAYKTEVKEGDAS